MESLGEYLRRERERRGMALEDIARVTRVRRQHLEAIEQDRYDLLPAPPFVRGFLSAYARQIGVAADEVLTRYQATGSGAGSADASSGTAGLDAGHDAASAPRPAPGSALAAAAPGKPAGYGHAAVILSTEPRPAYRGILVLAGVVALVALAVVGSILSRPAAPPGRLADRAASPSAEPGPAAPPAEAKTAASEPAAAAPASASAAADTVAGPHGATPNGPVTAVPAAAIAQPAGAVAVGVAPAAGRAPAVAVKPAAAVAVKPAVTSPVPAAAGPVPAADVAPSRLSTLAAVATEETWIQVTIDGGEPVEALLEPGARASWRGGRFEIVVGNAAGVTLELDGVVQPSLGDSGQKVLLTLPRSSSR